MSQHAQSRFAKYIYLCKLDQEPKLPHLEANRSRSKLRLPLYELPKCLRNVMAPRVFPQYQHISNFR